MTLILNILQFTEQNEKDTFKIKIKDIHIDKHNYSTNFINNIPVIQANLTLKKEFKSNENRINPITKAHAFITIINGKEYSIGFEANESDFLKYYPAVKSIINTFNPNEFNEKKLNENNYKQIDEKERFKNLTEKQVANQFKWKIYTDDIFKFNVSLPYINKNDNLDKL